MIQFDRTGQSAHLWVGFLCFSIYRGHPGIDVQWRRNWFDDDHLLQDPAIWYTDRRINP